MKEIDLTALGMLSSSTKAVLNKETRLTDLIGEQHGFLNLDQAISGKANFPIEKRQDLVKVLKTDYKKYGIHEHALINANIDALLDPNTYTVTTGQQLHLFFGPAFMVYKLISCIKAADHYQSLYSDKKFVPVFWLASEDHDFDEIKKTPLFGSQYIWETNQTGACGRFHLNDIDSVLNPLKEKLSNDSKAMAVLETFSKIYKTSKSLSEATIKLTHQLFADYGLLCLDADNPLLKAHFRTILKAELLENKSEASFNAFSQKLSDSQLSLQLKSRPINLFYLKDNLRARIEKDGEIYKVVDTKLQFTKEEVLAEIETHPENFSPNAVLRPLYQECILPNIAYIGGNAEINYWLQLTDVFKLYNTETPNLVLRQSVWMLKQKQFEWLAEKQIQIEQLFNLKSEKDKLNLFSNSNNGEEMETYLIQFLAIRDQIQQYANSEKLPNMKTLIEGGKAFEKTLKEVQKSEIQAKAEKNERNLNKLEQIQNDGFSLQNIQERTTYSLTFLINNANFVNNCFLSIYFKPGCGFFLNN
jgi:bacillithiol biosynthesis cysteine-adding enzyme BshC